MASTAACSSIALRFSDLDPNKIPPELLDKIANRMIEQALGSQAAVEEVNRRLAAGEPVALEDVAKAIEAPEKPGAISPLVLIEKGSRPPGVVP